MNRIVPVVLATAAVVSVAYAGLPLGGVSTRQSSQCDGNVTTTSGEQIAVICAARGRALYAYVSRRGMRQPLADGAYNLTNGGAIRVSGAGHIVWDAFGVVDRLNRGIPVAAPGTDTG